MSGAPAPNKKIDWFIISVVSYIVLIVVFVVLAPFTDGASLGGLCFLGLLAFLHGIVYVVIS
jgi:hypothetical protein